VELQFFSTEAWKPPAAWAEIIRNAGTVIWNGPVGVVEFEPFHSAQAIAHAVADRIDYISMPGRALPALSHT